MQPSEPGWYWAHFVDHPPGARQVVEVFGFDGTPLLVQRIGSEIVRPLSYFTDWSPRLIDPETDNAK